VVPETTDDDRVIRNADGVIVGIRRGQQGPNIVGTITLEPRRPARAPQVIITPANKGPAGGRATARKLREEKAQSRRRKVPPRMKGKGGGLPARSSPEMSEAKRRIRVDEVIQLSDLAHQMGEKASSLVRMLWGMGMRNITINSTLDFETADLVASEFGYRAENVAFSEQEVVGGDDSDAIYDLRGPVVTVMGHVDHGKTSLLDRIRKSDVATGEAGGITQHIGAYKVHTVHGDVVFLDTPGHEAFSAMRSRGAQITDIVVLVVAADDGIMPTTREAIKHAQDANTPILVAINKIDKPEANPGRVKQMLMEFGLVGEEFGGDTPIIEVSAKTGHNIEQLLEILALQAEVMDLRAIHEGRAQGTVIEARVDKGRGPMATMLVQQGTLRKGDVIVANEFSGKVRGIFDDRGHMLDEAGPGDPVEVLGLDGVPSAGDRVDVVENDRSAKQLVSHRREKRRRRESVRTGPSVHDLIAKKKTPVFKIVLRADVQGSVEALRDTLEALSGDKVKVEIIFTGVGAINETDVKLAHAGGAVIVGFNVKAGGKAAQQAESDGVTVKTFNVIYEASDQIKEMMIDLLEPEYREKEQGEAEVRALFPIPRLGVVAGCRVLKGKVTRSSHCRVRRDGKIIHQGKIGSLRVFKDDVREVGEGHECGIAVADFPEVQPGDVIEAFELEMLRATL
jgi:translation initiation factor IF-2